MCISRENVFSKEIHRNNLRFRFFIFPRIKADTAIVSQCVDPACVEFSGQFPCKDKTEWDNLDMDKAIELLGTVRLPADVEKVLFERLEAAC